MRKRKNRENKNKAFLSVILVIFLVSSLGGVILYQPTETNENSFKLDLENGKYEFNRKLDTAGNPYYEVNKDDISFTSFYTPDQIGLSIPEDIQLILKNSNYFYLTFDPKEIDLSLIDYLRYELKNNIPISKFFIDSVLEENDIYQLPIITCNNASITTPVINIKSSNLTNIEMTNNCITIEFAQQNTLQVRDSLVYLMHGINIG